MKNLFLTFTIIFTIILAIGTAANSQVIRPLPKLVQSLSNENYASWARWQNRQARLRARETIEDSVWDKYNYATQITENSFSRGTTSGQNYAITHRTTDTSTRTGYAFSDFNSTDNTTITARQLRYRNPGYIGASPVTTYNPYVRLKSGLGAPDWDNLYVPCKEGTLTMQEALDGLRVPTNAEKLFRLSLEKSFD